MRTNSKKTLLVIAGVLLFVGAGCSSKSTSTTQTNDAPEESAVAFPRPEPLKEPTLFSSAELAFEIQVPKGAVLTDPTILKKGEDPANLIGNVSIYPEGFVSDDGSASNKYISIRVFSDKAGLERFYSGNKSSLTAHMIEELDLKPITVMVQGKPQTSFAGTAESFYGELLFVEVLGPQYAYMLEFQHISGDPNHALIAPYLSTFVAK